MSKRALILKLLQDIRASYWFVPTCLVVVGLLLASGAVWIDRHPDWLPFELPDRLKNTQAEGARSLLAVIAQATLGVAGVTFSMTLVAVSHASATFGPRLIGNFMRDRGNQYCLGILIATFVYTIMVLRTIQSEAEGDVAAFVPHLAILIAIGLVMISVFALIFFIHHVPETINVSNITSTLGHGLQQAVQRAIDSAEDSTATATDPEGDPDAICCSTQSGYLQTINFDRLGTLAQENDWHISLVPAVGDFLTTATPVLKVWGKDVSDEDMGNLRDCFALGATRTEAQNPVFLAEQLVEMLGRALSPGVNDPYTAIDCLNRMTAALTVAVTYKQGLRTRTLDRITFPSLTFPRLFAATFPLCRQYILPDDMTRAHAIAALTDLSKVARAEDARLISEELRHLHGDDA